MIRRIRADEWSEWRDLRLRALRDAPSAFGSTFAISEAYLDSEWQARTRRGALSRELAIFISENGDLLDGCAALEEGEDGEGWLLSMWVVPQARGNGIGEALIGAVVARAQELGLNQVKLHVNATNSQAIALYERGGFAATGLKMPMERDASIIESEMSRPV